MPRNIIQRIGKALLVAGMIEIVAGCGTILPTYRSAKIDDLLKYDTNGAYVTVTGRPSEISDDNNLSPKDHLLNLCDSDDDCIEIILGKMRHEDRIRYGMVIGNPIKGIKYVKEAMEDNEESA